MGLISAIKDAVVAGKAPEVRSLVQLALDEGIDPVRIVEEALLTGMTDVGQQLKDKSIWIPEVLIASRALQAGLQVLRSSQQFQNRPTLGPVVIGTVAGDLHDIGKKLVVLMMEGKGIKVIDIGIDVPPEQFVEAVATYRPKIVAMSALLTTTMLGMRDTLDALTEAGLRDSVRILVGGGPVTQAFAQEIGADLYARDATTASHIAYQALIVAQPLPARQ